MVTDNIRAAYPKFRQSEQKAAEYMLGHMDDMENMTLAKMADTAGVSQPTVLRMLRRSGYDGFREVKIAVLKDRIRENGIWDDANDQVLGMPFHKGEKIEDIPGRIVVNTIELLNDSLKSISAKALEKTVCAIDRAGRVGIFSVEDSNSVAIDLQTKLMYLGISCEYNCDYYLQSIQAGHMSTGDVAIGISYTGTSINTVDVLKSARNRGATTIAITNFTDTPLAEAVDIMILTSDRQFLQGNDIFSRTVHMAVVDMIYVGLMSMDFDKYSGQLSKSGRMISKRRYGADM